MNISIKLDEPIEIINTHSINPLVSKCQIKVCWVGESPNRNKSVITKDVARELAQSLPASPIVGFYNEEKADFEEHNREIDISNGEFRIKDTTKPYGFVPTDAKVWFQTFKDFDGIDREYLVTEGYLWTGQYPECQRIIDEGNNQSMELDPNLIDANWTKDNNGKPQFFIINKAIISKLCILGDDCEPCFEGANITNVQFSLSDDFKEQLFSMMNKVEKLLEKGGNFMLEEEIVKEEIVAEDTNIVEEESAIIEENNEEIMDENEENDSQKNDIVVEDSVEIEEVSPSYSLDEVKEYQELLSKYSELETMYNSLVEQVNSLKSENESLSDFKKVTERAQKMDMIENEFSMLDDVDKAEVIEKIDEYSLSEIKKELSVICFNNKVNFNTESEKANDFVTTFSLENGLSGACSADVPDWVTAVMEVQKENF